MTAAANPTRRSMLLGAACLAAAGAAEALRPRKAIRLMREGAKLETMIPSAFGAWQMAPGGDIVVPRSEGSLASRLYDQSLARVYRAGEAEAMLMIAYGSTQSDTLQLHRPEACYPAVGFEIVARNLRRLEIAPGIVVPVVALTAQAGARVEDIVYWARLGYALPQTMAEQRSDRLRSALRGYVGDGALVRASAVQTGNGPQFAVLENFLRAMVVAVPAADRPSLIGDPRRA